MKRNNGNKFKSLFWYVQLRKWINVDILKNNFLKEINSLKVEEKINNTYHEL